MSTEHVSETRAQCQSNANPMSIHLANVSIGDGTSILYGSLTSLVGGRFQINFNSNPIQILIQSPNPTPIRCQSELQSHAESRELVLYEEATSLILFDDRSAMNLPIQDNKSPAILVQRPLYTYIIDNHQNWIETRTLAHIMPMLCQYIWQM